MGGKASPVQVHNVDNDLADHEDVCVVAEDVDVAQLYEGNYVEDEHCACRDDGARNASSAAFEPEELVTEPNEGSAAENN